jgi:hypothetical protein
MDPQLYTEGFVGHSVRESMFPDISAQGYRSLVRMYSEPFDTQALSNDTE